LQDECLKDREGVRRRGVLKQALWRAFIESAQRDADTAANRATIKSPLDA
jgi:hypothetical protein